MLKRVIVGAVTLSLIVLGAGLYWFQPWRLFTDTTVNDSLSTVAAAPSGAAPSGVGPSDAGPSDAGPSDAGPSNAGPSDAGAAPAAAVVVVRTGKFITHEHATTGTARLVRNADGSHQVELVGLDTSDGPDLRVWLTDQEVRAGSAGWRVFDDGKWSELGRLKGNRGDQVYPLPADIDPADYRSVSIWCKRFAVSFGAAALQ